MSRKIAFIFPGQGSQFIGMGKDLYDSFTEAREVFKEVDDTLKQKLSQLIFSGDIAELMQTSNAQPAIMATSIAALRVLFRQLGESNIGELCNIVAGHSLGEYSALCAANGLSLSETAKLLRIRGNAMQKAVPSGFGGMLALIGTNIEDVSALAEAAQRMSENQGNEDCTCQIANDNGAGQLVLSGDISSINNALNLAKDFSVRKAIKLKVSGPFHSMLMHEASNVMRNVLLDVAITNPAVPIIPNYTAKMTQNSDEIADLLIKQITGRVRWRETIELISQNNIKTIIELGPSQVLSKLAMRSLENEDIKISNFGLASELDKCMKFFY